MNAKDVTAADRPVQETTSPGRLWRLAGPPPDQRFAGRIRREQIGAILRLTPAMMLANIANGFVLLLAFWQTSERTFLVVWCLLLGLIAGKALWTWHRSRSRPPPETVSIRGIKRATLHAFTLGMLWAAIPLALFSTADGPQQMLLASLVGGMISGGGFALSTVPTAALAYSLVIVTASIGTLLFHGGMINLMVAALLLTLTMVITRYVFWNAGMFIEHLENQFDLERQRELIGILLRDFEESASDWLWETDEEGRLQHISPRFAQVTGRCPQTLQGEKLVDLLMPAETTDTVQTSRLDDQNMLRSLLADLQARIAFRDRTVEVQLNDDQRFWSLSAKPVHDGDGKFKGYRGVGTDVTDKIRTERKLAYLAHMDPLTDLANRCSLDGALTAAFRDLKTKRKPFALICLDLDGFKAVNDSYGHAAGDRLLVMVGQRLRGCIRKGDVAARIGGDEFVVLQKAGNQPESSIALAERMVAALSAPFDVQGRRLKVGASIGIAIGGRDGSNPMSLLRHADLALYRAKRSGRGCFLLYQPDMSADAGRKTSLTIPQTAVSLQQPQLPQEAEPGQALPVR